MFTVHLLNNSSQGTNENADSSTSSYWFELKIFTDY